MTLEAEIAQRNATKDLVEVLGSEAGRRVLWRILAEAKVFHENAALDALAMARSEGRRGLGLWLLAEVTAAQPTGLDHLMEQARRDNLD